MNPVTGALSHLAVSSIYGALFGVLSLPLGKRVPLWLAGVAYGLVLYVIARVAILPGTGSPLLEIPSLIFAAAHLFYGGVLGWLQGRIK